MNETISQKWKPAGLLKVCFCVIFHQIENVRNCSKWISGETITLQDLPELSAGLVFPSDLSHFSLLLEPFSFLLLISLKSTTLEAMFLKIHGHASRWQMLYQFCVPLSPKGSDKAVLTFIALAFSHPSITESVVELFENSQKRFSIAKHSAGYPYFPECWVEISTWSAVFL